MSTHARRFLEMLAAQAPGRATPARTSTMRQYATRLAADVPGHMLVPEVADAIAKHLPELPSYADVVRAVRSSPVQPARPVASATHITYAAQRDEAAEDLAWWRDRLQRWRDDPPEVELANLIGCLEVLEGRHPRQRGQHHSRPQVAGYVATRITTLRENGHEPIRTGINGGRPLHSVAPAPHGATVVTRPAIAAPAAGRPIPDDKLAALRQQAGIPT
jgi:hypothetical protein